MNTSAHHLLRAALFTALFSLSTLAVSAASPADAVALNGSVPVKSVGDYVQLGSYRIWVQSHLGKPSFTLADGSYLYSNRTIDESGATGTILIRFQNGQVSEMKLVSPAIVAALRTAPRASGVQIAQSHR